MLEFKHLPLYPEVESIPPWVEGVLRDSRICKSFSRVSRHFDEPFLYRFVAFSPDVRQGEVVLPGSDATGVSFDQRKALIKCAGEIAERHCLSRLVTADLPYGTFREKSPSLDINSFRYFSSEQVSTPAFSGFDWDTDSPFYWVKGESLTDGQELLIPAQLSYVPLVNTSTQKEPSLFHTTTTGAACGGTAEDSTLNAMLEVLERDAFMIHYLSRTPGIGISLSGFPIFEEILEYLARFHLELKVYLLKTDFPVCTVLAILNDNLKGKAPCPWMTSGMKCSSDPLRAVLGAIEEAVQTRPWVREMIYHFRKKPGDLQREAEKDPLVDRAIFWSKEERKEAIQYLTKSEHRIPFQQLLDEFTLPHAKAYETLLKFCRQENHPVYRVDITKPEVAEHGLSGSRVVMPTVQQFYLVEPHVPLAVSRWQTVPLALGLKDTNPEAPHPVPHFFL